MQILIRNGRVLDPESGTDRVTDLLIEEGKDLLSLIKYIAAEDRLQKVLENQAVLKQPVVRNGSKATVGYQPEVWKRWEQEEKQ